MLVHQLVYGINHAAGDMQHGLIHADKCRRVALIEITYAQFGLGDDFLNIGFGVKQLQCLLIGFDGGMDIDRPVKLLVIKGLFKYMMALWPEGVIITKTIGSEFIAQIDTAGMRFHLLTINYPVEAYVLFYSASRRNNMSLFYLSV